MVIAFGVATVAAILLVGRPAGDGAHGQSQPSVSSPGPEPEGRPLEPSPSPESDDVVASKDDTEPLPHEVVLPELARDADADEIARHRERIDAIEDDAIHFRALAQLADLDSVEARVVAARDLVFATILGERIGFDVEPTLAQLAADDEPRVRSALSSACRFVDTPASRRLLLLLAAGGNTAAERAIAARAGVSGALPDAERAGADAREWVASAAIPERPTAPASWLSWDLTHDEERTVAWNGREQTLLVSLGHSGGVGLSFTHRTPGAGSTSSWSHHHLSFGYSSSRFARISGFRKLTPGLVRVYVLPLAKAEWEALRRLTSRARK